MSCSICGEHMKAGQEKVSQYDKETLICGKCSYAEHMMEVKDPCVAYYKNTPKHCGIDEDVWSQTVMATRKNTDKYMMLREVKA